MDEILDYREDYPQAWPQANPPPCRISRGRRRGFRTRCLPHRAEGPLVGHVCRSGNLTHNGGSGWLGP